MTDIQVKRNTYMPGLDGLRALAVFAVIAFHLGLPFAPGGFLGVTLFFVLSGYLITDLMLSEWAQDNTINLKRFFTRRGKRLLPSIYFLLICLTAYVSVFSPGFLSNLKSEILPAAFSFSNWWYIFNKIPYFESFASPSLFTHFWSLAVEVQFYLIWPFLLFLVQRFIRKKWLKVAITATIAVLSAVLMAVLFEPGGDPSRIYYGTDTRVFSLLLGACLAFIYPSARLAQAALKKRTRILLDIAGFAALAAVLFMTYYITQYDDFLYYGGMVVFSVISALLVMAAAHPATYIGRLFSARPLKFVGNISYGVYLWQFPVIVITNAMYQSATINIPLLIFQVAATLLLATVSYYLIEMPIRKKNIIGFFKQKTFNNFCKGCLHLKWQYKTASLLVLALLLTTGIGMLSAQALPSSDSGGLSSVSSPNLILPPDPTDADSPPPASSPSPDISPDIVPGTSPSPDFPDSSPAVVSPSPGAATDSPPEPSDTPPESAPPDIVPCDLCITLIGDSVGIDIAPYLKEYYPNLELHAEVGRQFYQARGIVKQLLEKHQLSSTVIIELGSNGSFSEAQMRALIEEIGSDRKIIFINTQVPRSWCTGVNSMLSKISAEYDNTTVADWYSVSLDKKEYFYKDGFHPNSTGSPIMAKLVAEAIYQIHPYKPYMPIS